jgi:Ca-activated chloride channel family protein
MRTAVECCVVIMVLTAVLLWPRSASPAPGGRSAASTAFPVTQGSLIGLDAQGRPREFCPLTHTDVRIDVSGFVARARVTQQFENPSSETIEAVYTFPLPAHAAVNDLALTVGDRLVKSKIMPREDAQALYAAARTRGQVAGLLDQERPNVFTQSVANILPGEKVTVAITYVERLTYEAGLYELSFPMVVGPRYFPADPHLSRFAPPVALPKTRAGHDLSLEVRLDAGLPLATVTSSSHAIEVERLAAGEARVRLARHTTIPNKDFTLTYGVAGRTIQDAVLTHRNGGDGFVTLILQPPDRVNPGEVLSKELVFVLDTSGSMEGFPIEKAKETMRLALEGLYPRDTFNLITFSGDTHVLFPTPVPATKENLRLASAFLESRRGSGGTEMMNAIRAALDPSDEHDHIRIVCFMTDGYVGNDLEILAEVRKHPQARVFAFGIGSAVNRYLLDKMAEYGRGEVQYVGLNDDGSAAARRFHERIRNPLLTDLSIDWGRLQVTALHPEQLPDLFSAKPVVVTGRYTASGKGVVRLRGKMAGQTIERDIQVDLPAIEPRHEVLATVWARSRVDDLMAQDLAAIQRGAPTPEIRHAILQLGLDYRLLTQYTSFVAVEEVTVAEGGHPPRRIEVPVELPEGVSYEGIFGQGEDGRSSLPAVAPSMLHAPMSASVGEAHRRRLPMEMHVGKLHAALAALVEALKTPQAKPLLESMSFVRGGKAEVQIWLDDTSQASLAQLKELGIKILAAPKTAKLVIALVPIERLEALGGLKPVRYVAPLLLGPAVIEHRPHIPDAPRTREQGKQFSGGPPQGRLRRQQRADIRAEELGVEEKRKERGGQQPQGQQEQRQ